MAYTLGSCGTLLYIDPPYQSWGRWPPSPTGKLKGPSFFSSRTFLSLWTLLRNVLIRKAWTYRRNILCSLCKIRLRNKTACSCDESMSLYDPLANFCHSHIDNYAKRFSANQICKRAFIWRKAVSIFFLYYVYTTWLLIMYLTQQGYHKNSEVAFTVVFDVTFSLHYTTNNTVVYTW